MRVEIGEDGALHVTLSRRNLYTLIAKLDGHPPDSKCAIRAPANMMPTLVRAEEDDVHYGERKPDMMAPETEVELFVRNWEQDKAFKVQRGDESGGSDI